MKVYTEVIMQWDDNKKKLVEVSSKSHEYNGRIDECKKVFKPIGNLARGIGYDFLGQHREFSPTRMQAKLGGKLPTQTKLHPYTSFANRKLEGVNETIGSSGEFKSGWYEPMFQAYTQAPIQAMMGSETYSGPGANLVGGLEGPESRFRKVEDVLGQAGLTDIANNLLSGVEGMNLSAHGQAGHTSPLVAKGRRTDLVSAGQGLSEAQTAHTEELDRIEGELVEAEKAQKAGKLDTQIARMEALRDRVPGYEKARAAEAKTGMAYSAPARGQFELAQREGEASLSDIARDEADVVDKFRSRKSQLEGEEGLADERLKEAKADFGTNLAGIMEGTQDELSSVVGEAGDLASSWREHFGKGVVKGGPTLSQRHGQDPFGESKWGGGVGGGDYFSEGVEDISGLSDLQALIGEVGQIAGLMSDSALDMYDYSPEQDTPGVAV